MSVRGGVEIEIHEGYERGLDFLSEVEREMVEERIGELSDMARSDSVVGLYREEGVRFPYDYVEDLSSLYMFDVGCGNCVVLSYEDDPLFDKKIIRLYRICRRERGIVEFNEVVSLLYV